MIHKIEITMETNGTCFPDYEVTYTDNLDKRKIETMLRVVLLDIQTDPSWDEVKEVKK